MLTSVDGKGGKKGAGKGAKKGKLTLSMGPANAEVRFFIERATIPSKRVSFFPLINTTHAINIMYMLVVLHVFKKIYSLLCRLKINHMTENQNMFFLGSMVCTVANRCSMTRISYVFLTFFGVWRIQTL